MNIQEVFADVRHQIGEDIHELEQYEATIEELLESWQENRTEDEINAFRSNFHQYDTDLDESVSIEEVTECVENIQTAYEDPVRTSVEKLIRNLFDELGLSPEEQTVMDAKTRAINRADSLSDLRAAYDKIIEKMQIVPDPVYDQISEEVSQDPMLTSMPAEAMEKELDVVQNNHKALSEITGLISDRAWAPEQLPFQEKRVLYPDTEIDINVIRQDISAIQSDYEKLSAYGVSLQLAIKSHLSADIQTTSVSSALSQTRKKVSDAAEYNNSLEEAVELRDVESSVPVDTDRVEEQLHTLQEKDYQAIEKLQSDLMALDNRIREWKTDMIEQWEHNTDLLSQYRDILEEGYPTDLLPEDSFESLLDSPQTAVDTLIEVKKWRQDKRDVLLTEYSEAAEDLLEALLSDGEVYFSDYDVETVESVSNVVSIRLEIDES